MTNLRIYGTTSFLVVFMLLASLAPAFALSQPQPTLAPRIRARAGTSTNWSGYAVTGSKGSVTYAVGSWVVPTVTETSTNSYSSFWVGIDGYTSGSVEQIGTDSDWVNGQAQYYAWYEFYPKPSYLINTITVQPGDTMSAEVSYDGNTFTVTITDVTTDSSFSTTAKVPRAQRTSAEWIAEAPSSGGILPLADFGSVTFSECTATISSTTQSIGLFESSAVQNIMMVDSSGSIIASPSPLSTDGTSFSVTRITSSPSAGGTLTVDVSTDLTNYNTNSWAHITVTVTDGTQPIAGALATVTVTDPNGNISTGSGTTNSNGQVTFKYRIGPKAALGTYQVLAEATSSGYNPESGSTTFQVN